MSGGGKSQTSTQQVQIPPEVMARYNAVNKRAEATASKPFQQYSQDPNAFVAPLTATQQAGIQNVNQAANMAQPYFNTAAGLTLGGAQGVGPLTQQQIGYYQNPFTQSVVNSTMAGLQQQQGQAQSQQQAEAIKGGAFGGDRAGIQRAQLMGQQGLATAQAISPLYQRGYEQALQAAQGQQGVMASDLQRQLMAGQQLGGLGASGQQAALAGAQAQIGAGTAEQQTQQAGLQALYNQFLQERGYDFQTAQFLANIAMGTGALSGSTTTTTQPAPFFSDEREKTNVQPLGEGMYAYDYIDDVRRAEDEGRPMPPKRVGPMAQDIEERAPGLVGEVGGHKVVDASGGLGRMGYQSMGGMVSGPGAYATGGSVVGSEDMRAILAAIGQPLEFYGGKGLYGGAAKGGAGSPGYVPQGQIATPKLVTAGGMPRAPDSGLSQAAKTGSDIAGLLKTGKEGLVGSPATSQSAKTSGPLGSGGKWGEGGWFSGLGGGRPGPSTAEPPAPRGADKVAEILSQPDYPNEFLTRAMTARGGFMRPHYELGGSLPYGTEDQSEDPLADVVKEGSSQKHQLATPGKPPAPTPGLGSDLMGAASLAKSAQGLSGMLPAGLTEGIGAAASGLGSSLAGAGSAAASGLGSLAAGGAELLAFLPLMFSDERMKDNVEPVGELYDGQPIYRYNMKGSPQTQLGLMAQDVERNGHSDAVAGLGGVKMVDYKRATDVAAGLAGRNHAYRGGYQEGGLAEEDLPMLLAALQERAPEERRAPGLGPVNMSDADPVQLIRPRETDAERAPGLVVAAREPGGLPAEPPSGVVAPLPAPRVVGAAPGMRERAPGVAPAPRAETGTETGAPPRLLPSESGMSFSAVNPDSGAAGRAQFMSTRLEDAKRAGVIPPDMTMTQFLNDKDAQIRTEKWHFGDIRNFIDRNDLSQYVGKTINGIPVTADGLVNVAHIGGSAGMKRFVETGGRYNPADANGTRLSDYLAMGATGTRGGSGAPAPGVAGGQRPIGGVVPPEQIPSRSPISTLVRNATGVEGAGTPVQQALLSENLWIPALAGIGSMLASKSPYLAGAVGEGLQGGTAAYTGLQKQQSATDLEKSQSALTGVQGARQSIVYDAQGRPMTYLVPDGRGGYRAVPFYEVLRNPDAYNLSPQDRATMEEAARTAGITPVAPPSPVRQVSPDGSQPGGTQPGGTQPGDAGTTAAGAPPPAVAPVVRAGALEIPREGAYSVGVSPARGGPADAVIRAALPNADINNPDAVRAEVYARPQLAEKAETDKRTADEIVNRGRQLDRNITDLWQLASSINKISDDKFTATGAGQEYRAALANMYNTAARLAGVPGLQIDAGRDIDDAQIIRKLQALTSPQIAQQSGFHASSIANAISNAMPSGNLTKDAANTIITTMLVDLQKDRDFNRYYSQYINRFGTPLGVYESFNREMGDRYDVEKLRLKEAMTGYEIESRDDQGRPVARRESSVDVLRANPNAARGFDQRHQTPGLARYWRTN